MIDITGEKMGECEKKLVGKILNYFTNIGVAIVELNDTVSVGDNISIEGMTTNLKQKVESMQIEHKTVEKAGKGESIGLKIDGRCRKGDNVYKFS
jgi:U32 family peptidase